MKSLSKKEILEIILQKVKEYNISAYEISNNCNMTEAGVARILKGIAKNPHENSLNSILFYLDQKKYINDINKVEEHPPTYEKTNFDINKYISCIERENKLIKEIQKLQGILRKNNIEFDDNFEE